MSSVQIALAAEVERLRADLELHKGALIAEQEHVETLEAELAACQQDAERYRALRYAIAHGIDPDYSGAVMSPDAPPAAWLPEFDRCADSIILKVAVARKGEEAE
jgi:hypothetical protein